MESIIIGSMACSIIYLWRRVNLQSKILQETAQMLKAQGELNEQIADTIKSMSEIEGNLTNALGLIVKKIIG